MIRSTAVRLVVVLLPLAPTACAGGRGPVLTTLKILGPPVMLTPVPGLPHAQALVGEGLFNVTGLAWLGDTLVVVDGGNGRVVWTDGTSVGSFGRTGAGPGELRRPGAVRAGADGVLVLDVGNGRLAAYGRAGEDRGVVVLPWRARSFGLLADGAVAVPEPTGAAAFAWLGPDGTIAPRGVRPPAPRVPPLYTYPGMHGFDRVAVVGGRVVVADAVTGALGEYDAGGALVAAVAPPPAMLRAAFDAMRRIDEGFGGRVGFAPLYRDLTPAGGGRVFLDVGEAGLVGLLIDPVAGTGRVVLAPAGAAGRAARRSLSVVVRGDVYAFGTSAGVAFFRAVQAGP